MELMESASEKVVLPTAKLPPMWDRIVGLVVGFNGASSWTECKHHDGQRQVRHSDVREQTASNIQMNRRNIN